MPEAERVKAYRDRGARGPAAACARTGNDVTQACSSALALARPPGTTRCVAP